MAIAYQTDLAGKRHCPFCGVMIGKHLSQCPHCREAVPPVPVVQRYSAGGGRSIHRGMLWMLLGAVIYYFSGGYSPLQLPIPVSPMVKAYLAPVVILSGLALALYGGYQRIRR